MIPVVSVVSRHSNTGKTLVVCRIVEELKNRGYRVATIKHDAHDFEIDKPGKDSWKHSQAGSDIVILSSKSKFAMIEKVNEEYLIDEIVKKIENNKIDIVITEGYKSQNKPKIEVFRKEISKELVFEGDNNLFAIVTDVKLKNDVAQFGFDDINRLVDFIEIKFIKGGV